MKRLIAFVLCAALIFSCCPSIPFAASAATSGTCGDNLTWTLSNAGTLTISGTGPMDDFDYQDTPWYSNWSKIKTVVIQSGVTTIGDYAFCECIDLTSVTIGNSVTTIGDGAFESCSSLTSVTIPDSVITIGDFAFSFCSSLTSVTILDSVTTIGTGAFSYCTSLTSVTIPDSVTTIGSGAFEESLCIKNVYITDIVAWCNIQFGNVDANPFHWEELEGGLYLNNMLVTDLVIPDSVTTIGNYAFSSCASLTSVTIPDSVTTIGNSAFSSCASLTSVTIPDSVTTIGNSAFSYCTSLTSVTIPDGVTTIGYSAFECCDGLTSVTIPDSVTTIGDDAFRNCESLTSVTIPDSVTTIGDSAFYSCDSLTSVTIGNSVTTIGNSAFQYCYKLRDVYYAGTQSQWQAISIGSGNEKLTGATIHYNHVHDYTLLDPVIVPATCTADGYTDYTCAFGESYREILPKLGHDYVVSGTTVAPTCTAEGYTKTTCSRCGISGQVDMIPALGHDYSGATTVVDPTCTEQGYTGAACSRCDSVEKTNAVPALGHKMVVLPAVDPTCTEHGLTLGTGCERCGLAGVAQKEVAALGHNYINGVCTVCGLVASGTCGENLTWTLDGAGTLTISGTGPMDAFDYQDTPWYSNRSSIKTVVIQSGVTTIGNAAFWDCDSLTSVTIGDSVTTIGNHAFFDCDSLTSVTIGDSVQTIGNYAFFYCESLTSVTIPDSVTTIGDYAFSSCASLTSVTIGDSVTTIGNDAFSGCYRLTSVTIPDSVTTIGDDAFCYCARLTGIWVDANNPNYSSDAFGVLFNKDKTELIQAPGAISGSYTIPDRVTTIGNDAFSYCANLTSVTIGDSVTTIDKYAFYDCTSLTDVYYAGTQSQWQAIRIGSDNEDLTGATIHYNHVHTYQQVDATCTTDGYTGYNCVCGKNDRVVVPALGHDEISHSAKVPTCVEAGWEAYVTCSRCDMTTYREIPASGHNYVDGKCTACNAVTENAGILDSKGNIYTSLTDAIAATGIGEKLTIMADIVENVTVNKTVSIDLNGFSITGTVTIKDGSIVYGIDAQTDDFTINDEFGYGKISNVVLEGSGKLMGKPAENDNHGYMMITEADGSASFHCVNLKLKAMTLRAEQSGVYFKSDFAGDELVAENVKQFGVALSVKGAPSAETMGTNCLSSKFEGFVQGTNGGSKNGTLLKGVMKNGNTDLVNSRNANMPIYGRAYILTNDGQYVFGQCASRTFRQQVEAIDTMWADLEPEQKTTVQDLYEAFVNVMKFWTLPNLKETIA